MENKDEQALDDLLTRGLSAMGQAKSEQRTSIAELVERHIKVQQKQARLRPWLVGGCLLLGCTIAMPSLLALLGGVGDAVALADLAQFEFQLGMLRELPVVLILLALAGPAAVWLSESS